MCTAAEIRPDIKLTAGKPAAPVASGGPGSAAHSAPSPPLGGGGRGGGLGNLSCIFPLLFLSHSFSPALSSSSSCLPSRTFHLLSLLWLYISLTFGFVVVVLPLFSLSLHVWGHLTRPNPGSPFFLPSFRTLSPCHFLFPVRQLSFFLFLCYQNGQVPCLLSVTWPSSRSTNASLLLVKPSKPKPPSFMSFNPVSGHQRWQTLQECVY